jgi:hypothetical protein
MSEVLSDPIREALLEFDREQAAAPHKQSRQRANAEHLLAGWPALMRPIIDAANVELASRDAMLVLGKDPRATPRCVGSSIRVAAIDTHPGIAPSRRHYAPHLCLALTEDETVEAKVGMEGHCPHEFAPRDLGPVTEFHEPVMRRALADYVAFALRDIARHRGH